MTLPAPFSTTQDEMICRIAYDGSDQPLYVGYAAPGTADSAVGWQIKKNTWAAGLLTASNFAGSDNSYVKVWDDRAGYTYG